MKKIIIGSVASILVIGGAIGFGIYAQADDTKISTEQIEQLIGMDKAKEVALEKANGTVDSVALENDKGKTYYEVDIHSDNNKEFEVLVDGYTAKVLNVRESNDDNDENDRDDLIDQAVIETLITDKEAITIAKESTKGELVEIKLDTDDGRYQYEIKLRTDKGEAEITIDAITGEVLEQEFDDKD